MMNKKEILEQYFSDVNFNGRLWEFSHEGEEREIHDYALSNIISNGTNETLKKDVLDRSELQYRYYIEERKLKPILAFYRMRETKFSDNTPTVSIEYYSPEFNNWQGMSDKKNRERFREPEKITEFAKKVTKAEALTTIKEFFAEPEEN